MKIPKEGKKVNNNIPVENKNPLDLEIVFSFDILDSNEYFTLDGTCVNWSMDLLQTLKKVSEIQARRIYAGEFSGRSSTLRIHRHKKAKPPCKIPDNVTDAMNDLWQIRISQAKGGIHGTLIDNVFHIMWLDPQHNLYPDENHGGLVKIKPPLTCCKERDLQIKELSKQLKEAKEEIAVLEEIIE